MRLDFDHDFLDLPPLTTTLNIAKVELLKYYTTCKTAHALLSHSNKEESVGDTKLDRFWQAPLFLA